MIKFNVKRVVYNEGNSLNLSKPETRDYSEIYAIVYNSRNQVVWDTLNNTGNNTLINQFNDGRFCAVVLEDNVLTLDMTNAMPYEMYDITIHIINNNITHTLNNYVKTFPIPAVDVEANIYLCDTSFNNYPFNAVMYWNRAFTNNSIVVKNISSLARGTDYIDKNSGTVLGRDNSNNDFVYIGHSVPVTIVPKSENKELLPAGCPKRAEQPSGEYVVKNDYIDTEEVVLQPSSWLPFIHISTDRSYEELYGSKEKVVWVATISWGKTSEFIRNGLKVLPFMEGKLVVSVSKPNGAKIYNYIKDVSLIPGSSDVVSYSDSIDELESGTHVVDFKLHLSHINVQLYIMNSRCKIQKI
jgi:hypothetical protein